MHHYPHHIGDYRTHTAHLTMVEDGAYRRLLDIYYMHEKPLPGDIASVQRLASARTKEERAAVETILCEFFVLEDDGWHQGRADEEIAAYQERAEKARKNGRGGGRPKTQSKPRNNQPGYLSVSKTDELETQTEPSEKLTVNREPLTTSSEAKASGDKPPDVASVIFGSGLDWLKQTSGKPEDACRSLLGKWRRSLGDEALITTLGRAQREGALDPVGWIEGAVRARTTKPAKVPMQI